MSDGFKSLRFAVTEYHHQKTQLLKIPEIQFETVELTNFKVVSRLDFIATPLHVNLGDHVVILFQ